MKKIYFILFYSILFYGNSQIMFEHTYDTASAMVTNYNPSQDQLMMVNFEISGYQYVKINRMSKEIGIYDIGHHLRNKILCPFFPASAVGGDALYFSQHLFNTDSLIEFMFVNGNSSPPVTTIYNEQGMVLFSDTGIPEVRVNYPLQQYPIYNTPNGTKMILSYSNGQAKVFSLGGTLSAGIAQKSHVFVGSLGNAYPNPVSATTTVPYTLPPDANEGEVVLYNTEGTEVKRFRVDNTFANLQISTNDVPAGTYYYQLLVFGNAIGIKKLIVVR